VGEGEWPGSLLSSLPFSGKTGDVYLMDGTGEAQKDILACRVEEEPHNGTSTAGVCVKSSDPNRVDRRFRVSGNSTAATSEQEQTCPARRRRAVGGRVPLHCFDPDDRVRVSLDESGEEPWKGVGLLELDLDGQPFFCTGNLVFDRFVLTNAHCLWNRESEPQSKFVGGRFCPGFNGEEVLPCVDADEARIYRPWLELDPGYKEEVPIDFAMVRLVDAPQDSLSFDIGTFCGESPGLIFAGYPEDKNDVVERGMWRMPPQNQGRPGGSTENIVFPECDENGQLPDRRGLEKGFSVLEHRADIGE